MTPKIRIHEHITRKPEPPSEIIIERGLIYWVQQFGSHVSVLLDPDTHHGFPRHTDPMVVAKALKARAQGPICVVVNL